MASSLRHLWNNWSIQILVLLSLGLQLALFVFAGIRRRGAHYMLRFLLWLAYQLAGYTATYALGHLSIRGAQPVVAFWAPFLLLHLGGPDNITAYSLEDSKLWKRQLLHATLQVLGAMYVLYEHVASTTVSLQFATTLMFAVGMVKYWEKTRALIRGNLDTIRGSVRKQPPAMHRHFHPHDKVFKGEELDEESLVRRAHSLFHICKRAIVDYLVIEEDDSQGQDTTTKMVAEVRLWKLMETELSLMSDILYTKAAVIHTWFGYSVRLISPFAIASSLFLFKVTSKDAHRGADVVITYVLYGGALFMETTSLLNALGSSWTFAFLSTTRWRWLRGCDQLTRHAQEQWWGEEPLVRNELFHGILKDSLGVEFQECVIIWHVGTNIFLAKSIAAEEGSLDVEAIKVISNYLMFLLVVQPDMLPGLSQNRLYQRTCENLVNTRRSSTAGSRQENTTSLYAKLKNMFCLHDDPGSDSRVADREDLAKTLYDLYVNKGFSHDSPRLPYVAKLAKQLLTMEKNGTANTVKLVLDVWTDILVYASNNCSRKAHAEKLNSGGELITILWLMAEHFYQLSLEKFIKEAKSNSPGRAISEERL
ncbi:unnamed protein product [Alopecurus aequalis]